ncbi:hypothetical protein ACFA67_004545 [Salmonella enterica]
MPGYFYTHAPQQKIWIATPLNFSGGVKQKLLRGTLEMGQQGFDKSHVHHCANGKRLAHRGHIFREVPKGISRAKLAAACGEEIVRALMLGRVPDTRGVMCHPIAAEHRKTGEITLFYSLKALKEAGFHKSAVYLCIVGKQRQHKDHYFSRVIPQQWDEVAENE